jgi:exopolysaccharide biosynthesis protein
MKNFYFLSLVFLAIFSLIIALEVSQKRFQQEKFDFSSRFETIRKELENLQNQDQYQINQELKKEVDNTKNAFNKAVSVYEELLVYKDNGGKNVKFDEAFAQILSLLAKNDYLSAQSSLASLSAQIKSETEKTAATFKIPENLPVVNTPPSTGHQRQKVQTDFGDFLVDIISADLNSTKVIVDTASDSDCADNCPVLSLADYVGRSGAFAGVNGSYFCPANYPQCASKKNSFDTLLMNKNKTYFNSDNNVYSTVPAVIFSGNSARFVTQSLEWGRDTGVDAVLANQPLLLLNGQIMFGGNDDPKQGSKGNRSFVGATGSTVYIGVVHNATVAESARVLKSLGISNALNLDNGGSTALWSGGYKVGPGRNLPNVLLFLRK